MGSTFKMTTRSPGVNSNVPVVRVAGSKEACERYAALCKAKGWYAGSVIVVVEVAA